MRKRERSEAHAASAERRTGTDRSVQLEGGRTTRPRRSRASYRQHDNISAEETAVEPPIPETASPVEKNSDPPSVDCEVQSELTCCLCQELYINPVASPCGHAFCSLCHLRLFSVRLPGEPGVPPRHRMRPCPLCRQKHKSEDATPDLQLDARARTQHPELYARRSAEVAAAIEQFNETQSHYFTLTVGNKCECNEAIRTRSGITRPGRSDWEFFVELRDGNTGEDVDATIYIDRVTMHLSGGDGREVCLAPPYLVRRTTNGLVRRMCYAIVYFKPETRLQPVAVTWLLNMSPGRHCLDVPLELCRRQEVEEDNNGNDGEEAEQANDNNNNDNRNAPDVGYFGHYASVTGPVQRDAAGGGPSLISQQGPVAGLGSLYPVLAGLLETFIRLDNAERRRGA